MTAPIDPTRDQLRRLAERCEKRARRSNEAEARGLYHRTSNDARRAMTAPHLDAEGRRMALEAATAQARFAAALAGDEYEGARPLKPSELAQAFGMSERGALKAIVAGYDRRLPGFYCEPCGERCRWSATRQAFERRGDWFRNGSDAAAGDTPTP